MGAFVDVTLGVRWGITLTLMAALGLPLVIATWLFALLGEVGVVLSWFGFSIWRLLGFQVPERAVPILDSYYPGIVFRRVWWHRIIRPLGKAYRRWGGKALVPAIRLWRSARQVAREHRLYRSQRDRLFVSGADLTQAHFEAWSHPGHVNRPGFDAAITLMNERPQIIIETGTSTWGTDSTRLWDAYIESFGGEFWSVDISPAPSKRLARQVSERTHLVVDDSVHFLTSLAEQRPGLRVDVCYLDSWDLDFAAPDAAAAHGLAEWHAVSPLMGAGSILIIDDTPGSVEWVPAEHQEGARNYLASFGYLPGKGSLVHQELASNPHVRVVWHGYNVVYHFGPT